jgi:hypothetical protein
MGEIDLKEFLAGISGKPYNSFIEHHLRRQSDAERKEGLQWTIQQLPPWFIPSMEHLIDEWNETGRYSEFWKTDCAIVFNHIAEHAKNLTVITGGVLDDDDLFNIFQVVTLNFAIMASESKEVRKFAGIRKGFFG